jgi:hypothetical protein
LTAPTPLRPGTPQRTGGGRPPAGNGHGNGHGSGIGWPEEAPAPQSPRRRRSIWPFVLDLGLTLALFGLIITAYGPLIVVGAIIAVVGLAGWIREARADYTRLKD